MGGRRRKGKPHCSSCGLPCLGHIGPTGRRCQYLTPFAEDLSAPSSPEPPQTSNPGSMSFEHYPPLPRQGDPNVLSDSNGVSSQGGQSRPVAPIATWPPPNFDYSELENYVRDRIPYVPVVGSYAPVSTPCPISVVRTTPGVSLVHSYGRPIVSAPPIDTSRFNTAHSGLAPGIPGPSSALHSFPWASVSQPQQSLSGTLGPLPHTTISWAAPALSQPMSHTPRPGDHTPPHRRAGPPPPHSFCRPQPSR